MNLDQLRAFLAVVERRSFTGAGRVLGVTKQTVSRRVGELEEGLGVALLVRSTRRVALTEEGEIFARDVRRGLDALADGVHNLAVQSDDPADEVWIGAPALFARHFLAPVVQHLLSEHRRLRIGVCALGAADALDFDLLDVIISVGPLRDLAVKRIPLGDAINGLFAAPAYLEAHGPPTSPPDLHDHACLAYRRHRARAEWVMRRGSEEVEVPVQVRFESNDADVVVDAAVAGMGIAHLPLFLGDAAVAEEKLVRVMPRWTLHVGTIAALYRETRAPRPAVELVLDAVRAQLMRVSPVAAKAR